MEYLSLVHYVIALLDDEVSHDLKVLSSEQLIPVIYF